MAILRGMELIRAHSFYSTVPYVAVRVKSWAYSTNGKLTYYSNVCFGHQPGPVFQPWFPLPDPRLMPCSVCTHAIEGLAYRERIGNEVLISNSTCSYSTYMVSWLNDHSLSTPRSSLGANSENERGSYYSSCLSQPLALYLLPLAFPSPI